MLRVMFRGIRRIVAMNGSREWGCEGLWMAVKVGILAIYSGAMISLYNLCGGSSFFPLVRYERCVLHRLLLKRGDNVKPG